MSLWIIVALVAIILGAVVDLLEACCEVKGRSAFVIGCVLAFCIGLAYYFAHYIL